jgi:hypothetical protein
MPSAENPGKDSRRRPSGVSEEEMERRWAAAFRPCIHIYKDIGYARRCIYCDHTVPKSKGGR